MRSLVRTCDVVFCCYLGENNLIAEGQKLLVDACEVEGVRRHIVSDHMQRVQSAVQIMFTVTLCTLPCKVHPPTLLQ